MILWPGKSRVQRGAVDTRRLELVTVDEAIQKDRQNIERRTLDAGFLTLGRDGWTPGNIAETFV